MPAFLSAVPRAVLVVPIVGFLLALGLTIGRSSDEEAAESSAPPTIAVAVTDSRPLPPATATPEAPVTPMAPEATAVVIEDRSDCDSIRGTDYRSAAEQDWFQENCLTAARAEAPASAGATTPAPVLSTDPPPPVVTAPDASAGGSITGSSDRIVLARLGIDAPVNYRAVGSDGVMGNPIGAYDAVWYDFGAFPGLGGYPGNGGNAVIAGHVDYRGVGPAVFFELRNIAEGDIIEYHRGDGQVLRYAVQWFGDYSPSYNWASIVSSAAADVLTLVTCNGAFDYSAREYSHRRVVRAQRIQ